jgi:hypothetical protein
MRHYEALRALMLHLAYNMRGGVYVSEKLTGVWIHRQYSPPFPEAYGSLACQLDV